jgi:hypothetical protein
MRFMRAKGEGVADMRVRGAGAMVGCWVGLGLVELVSVAWVSFEALRFLCGCKGCVVVVSMLVLTELLGPRCVRLGINARVGYMVAIWSLL